MRFSFAFILLSLALSAQAAPVTRDLGQGLLLQRLHTLPADLPGAEDTRRQARIIDVRYVKADTAAASGLQAWLRSHASQRTPLFVIANAETSPAVLATLAAGNLPSHTLVVGIPAGRFKPDIPIDQTAENERRAYDALESGTALALLLTENGDKARNDEASLSLPARSFDQEGGAAAKAGAPPLDLALQRALHLHRALVALKKL